MGIFSRKKDISNMIFDWDLYWKDIGNGVDNNVILKRMENLYYYVSKSDKPYGKIQAAEYAK